MLCLLGRLWGQLGTAAPCIHQQRAARLVSQQRARPCAWPVFRCVDPPRHPGCSKQPEPQL